MYNYIFGTRSRPVTGFDTQKMSSGEIYDSLYFYDLAQIIYCKLRREKKKIN